MTLHEALPLKHYWPVLTVATNKIAVKLLLNSNVRSSICVFDATNGWSLEKGQLMSMFTHILVHTPLKG